MVFLKEFHAGSEQLNADCIQLYPSTNGDFRLSIE